MTDHVRTEAGVKKYHEPIGSPIVSHAQARAKLLDVVSALEQEQAGFGSSDAAMESYIGRAKQLVADHPELADDPLLEGHSEITGKPPSYRAVAQDYGWDEMDEEGGDGTPVTTDSIHTGHQAQITAKFWSANVTDDSPDDEQYASSLWEQYQSPQLYGAINGTLRDDEAQEVDGNMGPDPDDMRRYVDLMFEKGGTVLDHDIVLYRALHSSGQRGVLQANLAEVEAHPEHPDYLRRKAALEQALDANKDWAEFLKPGTEFTDKGIMSTTPHPRYARGWLGLNAHGDEVDAQKPDDVVIEIHVPKGTTILGGDPQFVEVMLGRGTTLKINSSEKRQAEDAVNPLQERGEEPFTYTHVVAEVTTK